MQNWQKQGNIAILESMDPTPLPYTPGSSRLPVIPLARYLPPLPGGMVSAWLREHIPPGSWILDPLGASPTLALEAARAGFRVLVASNNPIISFLIETLAAGYTRADFQAALADLAVSRRGDERLEQHILGLYTTKCESCGALIPASAYLWRKGEAQPYARIYHCRNCGEAPDGERALDPVDLERLAALGGDKLQRARALQRVILNETEHRADVEEALECYLPRPLYALFTLLNKIEGLGGPQERIRPLQALLLSAFDDGSTLAHWTGGRARPKQLSTPTQFRENNLWMALEAALEDWAPEGTEPAAVPVSRWSRLPDETGGAICLFRGRVKALMPLPTNQQPKAIVTVYPRPNQAFWTLSTLWSGWLWGAEAALPLRNVLDRRRYDWNWHTSAIHSALAAVGWNTLPETPLFGVLPELNPGFLSAAVAATQAAGFQFDGLALRAESSGRYEQSLGQVRWHPVGSPPPAVKIREEEQVPLPDGAVLERAATAAVQADLTARNEPAPYLTVYAAALSGLINLLPRSMNSIPGELLTRVQAAIARIFADRSLLKRYGGQAEESGWWWLADASPDRESLPLSDRIEMEIVRYLQREPHAPHGSIDAAMCEKFPNLSTPDVEWLRACLESYSKLQEEGVWQLRPEDVSTARRQDLQEMDGVLQSLARGLGYQSEARDGALVWLDERGTPIWRFYRMASSIASRFVFQHGSAAGKPVLVLPGSRAALLSFKRIRDMRLHEALSGWHILKFRQLRELAQRKLTTEQVWLAALEEDPITVEATQMALFSNG